MTEKPLTKALHTTRVVERLAIHLNMTGTYDRPSDLFIAVLNLLGNMRPVDSILDDQCIEVCRKVLS